jgi:hypothetical protein
MRTAFPALALFGLLVAAGIGGGTAFAEKAKAKDDAKIYNRAGERGEVVIKLKEGQVMRITRKDGRWLKVSVAGRTGWIPRSKVELIADDDTMARNTRRRPFVDGRSTKRGFGGATAPEDRVGADAIDDKKGSGGSSGGSDDEEDDEEPDDPPAKPVAKGGKPAKPPAAKPKPAADDEEDGNTEGDEPKSKGDDDDDEGAEVKDERPKAKVKKKVVAYSEANAESEESFSPTPTTTLHLTGNKKGKFVEVETEDGDIGFVLASDLESGGGGGGGGGGGSDEEIEESGESGPKVKGQIDVRGRLGVTIIQQGTRSAGSASQERPDNYDLSTSAMTIALGGSYLRPYKKAYIIGGELAIDIAKAIPGVKVDAMNTTGITVYNVNARATFGKDFHRKSGMAVFGRLGFRFYSYQIGNATDLTKNTANLPSEIVKAPTLGAALALPKLTDKIGLRFSLDAVLVGASMQQTEGLEDGNKAGVKGVLGGVGFTYRWKPSMDINAAYDLNFMKYDFGAPVANMRGHDMTATAVTRTDIFHGVTVGVAKAF